MGRWLAELTWREMLALWLGLSAYAIVGLALVRRFPAGSVALAVQFVWLMLALSIAGLIRKARRTRAAERRSTRRRT